NDTIRGRCCAWHEIHHRRLPIHFEIGLLLTLFSLWLRGFVALKKNRRHFFSNGGFVNKDRQRLTLPGVILVPSALVGLTSLFGMGRGDPHRYSHLNISG